MYDTQASELAVLIILFIFQAVPLLVLIYFMIVFPYRIHRRSIRLEEGIQRIAAQIESIEEKLAESAESEADS